jgi:hypothetical protein
MADSVAKIAVSGIPAMGTTVAGRPRTIPYVRVYLGEPQNS